MTIDPGFLAGIRDNPGAPLILVFEGPDPPGGGTLGRLVTRCCGSNLNRIVLADLDRAAYYRGVPGLGETIEATAEALGMIIEEVSPSRVVAFGSGVGGHAAMVYGVLLQVDRIVAIEPVAHFIGEVLEVYHDHRWPQRLGGMPDQEAARRFELPGLMDRLDFRGEAHVLFGTRRTNNHLDAVHLNSIHAHWLARSGRVILHPFPEIGPEVVDFPAVQGEAAELLSKLLSEAAPIPPPPMIRAVEGADPNPTPRPVVYDPKLTICRIEDQNPANRTGGPVTFGAAGEVDSSTTRKIDDDLRSWIVENLLLDASPKDLADTLAPQGISPRETLMEVDLARFHPVYLATKRAVNRIKKRDWLLATYRKLDRMRRRPMAIERRDSLSRDDFLRAYASTGRPVLIDKWTEWPNPATWQPADLARTVGDLKVEVAIEGEPERGDRMEWTTLAHLLEPNADGGPVRPRSLVASEGSPNQRLWEKLQEDLGTIPEWFPGRDRSGGVFWLGLEGAIPPPLDQTAASLVALIAGRLRVRLVMSWDVDLMEEQLRSAPVPEYRPMMGSHFPPLDRPEVLELTMTPAQTLFVPAGCQARFECSEPLTLIRFKQFDLGV